MAAKAKASRTIPPLVVRYPRRMRPQKAYAVQVSWRSKEKARAGTGPYTVRLVMGGAQVVPSEQTMDPTKPGTKATFYVTSLARKGWLKGERLEVLADGEKVQEIGLPAKVTSQRKTWMLLLLTFLVPWFWMHYIHVSERDYFKGKDAWGRLVDTLENDTPLLDSQEAVDFLDSTVKAIGMTENTTRGAYNWVHRIIVRDELFTDSGTITTHLPFWIGVGLFVLTLLSWWFHREKYRRKVGKPLAVAAGDEYED